MTSIFIDVLCLNAGLFSKSLYYSVGDRRSNYKKILKFVIQPVDMTRVNAGNTEAPQDFKNYF